MLDPVRNYSRIIVINRTAVKHKCHEPQGARPKSQPGAARTKERGGFGGAPGNPKPEGRNPKETRNPKFESRRQRAAPSTRDGIYFGFRISDFGLLSVFGFRVSGFRLAE